MLPTFLHLHCVGQEGSVTSGIFSPPSARFFIGKKATQTCGNSSRFLPRPTAFSPAFTPGDCNQGIQFKDFGSSLDPALIGRPFFQELIDIEHPNAAAMRTDDQFIFTFLNHKIVHRHLRQIRVQDTPSRSCVKAGIGASVGPDKEQVCMRVGFNDGIDGFTWNTVQIGWWPQSFPRPAVVLRYKDVRFKMVQPVTVESDVKSLLGVVAPEHFADP